MAEFCDHFKLLAACQWQIEIFIQSSLFLTVPKEYPVSMDFPIYHKKFCPNFFFRKKYGWWIPYLPTIWTNRM